jgi:hypothetical protein
MVAVLFRLHRPSSGFTIFFLKKDFPKCILGYHQRVLEHCDDENTQNAMMEEIMQSVVTLTEDQYGNYVIQVTF